MTPLPFYRDINNISDVLMDTTTSFIIYLYFQ